MTMNQNRLILLFALISMLILVTATMNIQPAHADKSVLNLGKKRLGDFDEMTAANRIRALVPYSKTFYFLDGADQRGLTYDLLKEFEKFVNLKLNRKTIQVHVIVIPTKRELLFEHLVAGRGDIAAGNLTITQQRLKLSDFAEPFLTGTDEIIVTGPKSPQVNTVDDLAGKEIYVRASSSYYSSLNRLNSRFKKNGQKMMKIKLADDYLEDEDLLEMMNAGLIPMIVIDSHKGEFWSQIFKNIKLHPDIENIENNIHAGVKYLRFLRNRYFEKEPMDTRNKMLFTFASYNAGAGKIARLRQQAQSKGLDPNIWFRNVEIIAAEKIGRETVQHVSNIYKYYVAYRLILDKLDMKAKVKKN